MVKRAVKALFRLYIKIHEKSCDRVKYLWFGRHSNVLAIVFSAFDSDNSQRAYNYVRSLSRIPIDFIFLSDPFGYRGSYYLYDNGSDNPKSIINSIIQDHLARRKYSKVVTLGTSKGGTAALYYGLTCHATDIIVGACQYRIGSYVAEYPDIFKGMTGKDVNNSDIESLNSIMPQVVTDKYDTPPNYIGAFKQGAYI